MDVLESYDFEAVDITSRTTTISSVSMSRPNILFIVMDTARARNALPSTSAETVPRLAEFMKDGVEFSSAISTAPWTLPSHASLFTGQYTSDHGTNAGNKQFTPSHAPLPELLNEAGYTTVGFSNNSWVSPDFGFDRGFDQFYPGWTLLENGADLAPAMREYDEPLDQLRELIRTTSVTEIPAMMANAAYAKFFRKRYDYGATVTNWKIKRWFKKEYTEHDPFFMFINYLEPHLEYDPPKKYCNYLPDGVSISEARQVEQDAWGYVSGEVEMTQRDFEILEGLYNSELAYLDHRIGQLLDDLSERGVLDDTMVIIVGDHGENIGDHGLMDHQYCLYDTLIHVPLLIRGPNEFKGGRQIERVVESRSLFPTILEAAGAEIPEVETISSNSLFETLEPTSDDERGTAIAEYLVPQPAVETLEQRSNGRSGNEFDQYDRALRAVRTGKWKFIESSDGTRELYDIAADPEELTDVSTEHSDIADELQDLLNDERGLLEKSDQDTGSLDSGAQQRLEDLGYI